MHIINVEVIDEKAHPSWICIHLSDSTFLCVYKKLHTALKLLAFSLLAMFCLCIHFCQGPFPFSTVAHVSRRFGPCTLPVLVIPPPPVLPSLKFASGGHRFF